MAKAKTKKSTKAKKVKEVAAESETVEETPVKGAKISFQRDW